MRSFSSKTIDELKFYVYVYSDPDTHKPFYVGKGKGNRAFSHLNLDLEDQTESEKVRKIKEIEDRGKEPLIEILVHGLDEDTALKVEAAAIDLIGIENLTNQQRGHDSSVYGKIEASVLNARYTGEELKEADIKHNVLMIRINQLYRNGMSKLELYEATRGYWVVDLKQAEKVELVFSVYDGMVVEVYRPVQWFPGLSTFTTRKDKVEPDRVKPRYEFVGNIAEEVRNLYVGKSVAGLFPRGNQNPVKYIWKDEKGKQRRSRIKSKKGADLS